MGTKAGGPRTINAVEKMLDIVDCLKSGDPTTLGEISEAVDLSKSTVHAHLATLHQRGFVVRDDGEYRLGSGFLDVGLRFRDSQEIFHAAKPTLHDLAEKTGELVALFVEEQGELVNLFSVSGEQVASVYMRDSMKIGRRKPIHCSAAGKAILAEVSPAKLDEIIETRGLPRSTSQTITDPDELREELEATRQRGYAYNLEEMKLGRNGIGAVVEDDGGEALAGIGVSGPTKRVRGDRLESELPGLVLGATNEIELNLKYS